MISPLKILIVDDDPMMGKTLSDILKHQGHQTVVAHSGAEALARASAAAVDCVLSDIRMPDLNGVELHQALKRALGDVPTVLMTAYSETPLIHEGIKGGVIAVFTKPIDLDALSLFLASLSDRVHEFTHLAEIQALGSVLTASDLAQDGTPSETHTR